MESLTGSHRSRQPVPGNLPTVLLHSLIHEHRRARFSEVNRFHARPFAIICAAGTFACRGGTLRCR